MSHVRGRFINTWQLLICDSISSSQYGQACQYPKLWPKSCRLVANGREQCFVHSSVANCQFFGWTLWFYICLVACWQISNDNCKQFTAADFETVKINFAKFWPVCEMVFSHSSQLWTESVFSETVNRFSRSAASPNLLQTKCRCSPSINKLLLHLLSFSL